MLALAFGHYDLVDALLFIAILGHDMYFLQRVLFRVRVIVIVFSMIHDLTMNIP